MNNFENTKLALCEKKLKDSVLLYTYDDLLNYEQFRDDLLRVIKLYNKYSILVRVSYLNEESGDYTQYKMIGNQIGIYLESVEKSLEFSKDIHNNIISRIKYSMDTYNYVGFDVINIQLLIFGIGTVDINSHSKFTRKSLEDASDLLNVSKTLASVKKKDMLSYYLKK